MPTTLKFRTLINTSATAGLQIAKTHFGTVYTLDKDRGAWIARIGYDSGGEHVLASGVSFAEARKAANDDYKQNGGR